MAELAILALLLVAVVAIAEATTITTTIIEDNPQGHQGQQMQCMEQIQRKGFTHCVNYMHTQGGSRSRGRFFTNPQEMHLQECCEQLESVDEDCRCSAIQKALQRAQQERQIYQGQEMQRIMRVAMDLPKQCQWNEPQHCQIRAVFV